MLRAGDDAVERFGIINFTPDFEEEGGLVDTTTAFATLPLSFGSVAVAAMGGGGG